MAKVLRCRDVGLNCDFEARGESVDEIMDKTVQHARTVHGMEFIPPEVASKVQAAIHDE